MELQVYKSDASSGFQQVNPSTLLSSLGYSAGATGSMNMSLGSSGLETWTEMLDNDELLRSQYEVIAGDWPQAYNEIVLVVNKDNELSDMTLYSLGLLERSELDELIEAARDEV